MLGVSSLIEYSNALYKSGVDTVHIARRWTSFWQFLHFSFLELQESSVRLKLTIVDSVGFGDQINKEDRSVFPLHSHFGIYVFWNFSLKLIKYPLWLSAAGSPLWTTSMPSLTTFWVRSWRSRDLYTITMTPGSTLVCTLLPPQDTRKS